jgi:septal ring factor EnvC (AmiA/AmiB activator)
LDAYDKKSTLMHALIRKLQLAEKNLEVRIDSTKTELRKLEGQLKFLRNHYAGYVTSVYKAGQIHDLELLLTAHSINQALIRVEPFDFQTVSA